MGASIFPEIEKKIRRHLRPTNDSWRVDETYIKVKGKWKYFYRAVDSNGNTIDLVPLQKILILKQNFSFTSKNIKRQNISQITSRFKQLFRITGL